MNDLKFFTIFWWTELIHDNNIPMKAATRIMKNSLWMKKQSVPPEIIENMTRKIVLS